jgi:hypothetical protein
MPPPQAATTSRPAISWFPHRAYGERRDKGEETLADIGRSYNVSPATISRLIM